MTERELSERSEANVALFESGKVFGRYEIVRCVGVGGMAIVYEAVHTLLKKSVALKVLHPRLRSSDSSRARFLREAEIAARVRHPNVVDITDVGLEQGVCFLVMEFLEGEDLGALLERDGQLDITRAVDIIVPVAAGLAAVHKEGIIHRDLKPENIILSADSGGVVPKIVDFGVSKDLLSSAGSSHTVAGTPTHMAPEQARGGAVDGRADQYSLALIAYQCLTGALPYEAGSLLELMQLIELGEYRPIRDLRPQLSAGLESVIQRAMMSLAEARYPTIVDFGAELLAFASPAIRNRYAHELDVGGGGSERKELIGAVNPEPGVSAVPAGDLRNAEHSVRSSVPDPPQLVRRAGASDVKSEHRVRNIFVGGIVLVTIAAIAIVFSSRTQVGQAVRPVSLTQEAATIHREHAEPASVPPQATVFAQAGALAAGSLAASAQVAPPTKVPSKKARPGTRQASSPQDPGIYLERHKEPVMTNSGSTQ